jgi:ATP-dependent RNA helicase DDX46/PRP5
VKNSTETDKLPTKRKLDLDEEDTTKRKLTKLPALPIEADDTPYADQDDDESDGDNFAETEEESAAAARAAHERRLQAENQMDTGEEESKTTETQINGAAMSNNNAAEPNTTTHMEIDEEEDDVDPLDAFMADLKQTDVKQPAGASKAQKIQEPEAYFSDDEYDFNKKDAGDANALLAMTAKRKKKDIPAIDYSKIEIEPIRKNFWVEPAELSQLTEAEVADLRLELDGIKVNGKDVPKPVQKWAQCGLTRQTLDVIDNLGFEKPTPIQMQALPALMSGRDVIGVAKTGSGKTMAFLLPMFRHIKDQPPLKDTDGPIGLIMTPPRELAVQIHRDCKPFLKMMGLRSVCAYGGAPIRDQIAELKRGAEIIVCTPGRMIDLLAANQGRVTNLKRVTYVVLDEADRMFDMGFEPQVMKIFANMRPDRQTILFSATMPRIIDSLTKKVLNNPIEVTVGGRSVVAKEIDQIVEVRDEPSKFLRVLELLGELYDRDEDARTLIFVERQEKADDLLKELMIKGYPCMSIHGGKDQIDRDSTISDFKKGVVPILIATSVAARGLDVKQLKLVINYDAPNHLEDYVHRAGRTGRAGNTGVAVTFVTPEQENCSVGIAKALEQSGQPVPERLDEMRKAHREKVKSGKAKDTSGFGGKGLDRLDQEREAARLRERKTHKAEGEEEEVKEDKKEEEDDKAEKALSAIRAAASGVQARESAKAEGAEVKPTQQATITGGANDKSKDPLDKVSSAVSAINSRLGKAGQLRAGQPIDNKGPDAGAFHATLEINDFPQKARWAVTNRTNVAKILEATGTSITTKGNFYPPGKEVPAGAEPKLYILIEGDTEVVVGSALSELTRLLREGTIAAADADSRAPASGRYTIT